MSITKAFLVVYCHRKRPQTELFCCLSTVHYIPASCPTQFSFSAPALYTLNGINVTVYISITNSVLQIKVHNVEVDLEILEFSTECCIQDLPIILALVQQLQLCSGIPYKTEYSVRNMNPAEEWGYLGSSAGKTLGLRLRRKSCKNIVAFTATTKTYANCKESLKYFKKKHEQQHVQPTCNLSTPAATSDLDVLRVQVPTQDKKPRSFSPSPSPSKRTLPVHISSVVHHLHVQSTTDNKENENGKCLVNTSSNSTCSSKQVNDTCTVSLYGLI